MIRTPLASLVLLLVAISPAHAQQPATTSAYVLKAVADRPDAIYKTGEQATFAISLTKAGQNAKGAEVRYRLSLDGYSAIGEGTVSIGDQTTVTSTLSKPGFVRLQVDYTTDDKKTVSAVAAAGFDPLQIPPSLEVPDDFDSFWAEQKRELAKLPINARLTSIASSVPTVECFDVQADCTGGKPISGYFARPKDAKPKSLPAVMLVHGAGVRSSNLGGAVAQAAKGRLALDMNAHGIPNGKPAEFYDALTKGELANYRAIGRESRETVYFRGMLIRLVRGLDFLCSQSEWDGRILIVMGGSQGGGQAIAAAGLDPRVTAIYAGVPALCDHSGNVVGRIAGWPKIVPLLDGKPAPRELQAARYVDGLNFATRTKADAIVTVGFIDGVCPPTAVYATYNNLRGHKRMVTGILNGHEGPRDAGTEVEAFMAAHIVRLQSNK